MCAIHGPSESVLLFYSKPSALHVPSESICTIVSQVRYTRSFWIRTISIVCKVRYTRSLWIFTFIIVNQLCYMVPLNPYCYYRETDALYTVPWIRANLQLATYNAGTSAVKVRGIHLHLRLHFRVHSRKIIDISPSMPVKVCLCLCIDCEAKSSLKKISKNVHVITPVAIHQHQNPTLFEKQQSIYFHPP